MHEPLVEVIFRKTVSLDRKASLSLLCRGVVRDESLLEDVTIMQDNLQRDHLRSWRIGTGSKDSQIVTSIAVNTWSGGIYEIMFLILH